MGIKKLLEKVEYVVKQNEEISALKGENFNVFQIFDMESDENKMHSRFINTLINPKGSHSRGTIFLELFLEAIGKSSYFDNLDNVSTKVEHSIGKVRIDGMKSTGGRIDIFICDSNKSISIENKIYANDQEKQIVRYWNYQKDKNTVFYLNLHGSEPIGNNSAGVLKSNKIDEESPDFYCISYSDTILDWLEKCQKEASDFPVIRETIKQYIITIKRITRQLTNQEMSRDINNLIIENYNSASIIADNIDKAKIKIIDAFLNEIEQSLKNELGDDWVVEREDTKKRWSKLKIRKVNWRPDTTIAIQAESRFWKNESILGLPSQRGSDIRSILEPFLNEDNLQELKSDFSRESKAWFFYKTIFNLSKDNQFMKLLTDDTRIDFIKDISSEVIKLAHMLEDHLKKA